MSQPLLATARIEIAYTVQGLVHKIRTYCAFNLVLGIPQLVDRDGITTILWTLAAQRLWTTMTNRFSPAAVPNPATASLQQRSGAIWNPVAFSALTGVGLNGNPVRLANQLTIVVRDTLFKKLRVVMLETSDDYVGHSATGAGMGSSIVALCAEYDGSGGQPEATYRWAKSRGDRFLLASGAIAGVTFDLNDKLKRARGFE